MHDLLVIGGGAAGFYGAIHAARRKPGMRIAILEQNKDFLSKVRISGGGRCNLTHRPMDPGLLSGHYPRGSRELIGPFHTHASQEVMAFFESLGIPLKTEEDGRVFPRSNQSESIIMGLMGETTRLGIELHPSCRVTGLGLADTDGNWEITSSCGDFRSRRLLVTAGSSRSIWNLLENLGHRIVPPTPSLFTFRIRDPRIQGLQGISAPGRIEVLEPGGSDAPVAQANFKKAHRKGELTAEGPVLITHWGLSGPAVLRLSAWGSRLFAALGYKARVRVNWLPDYHKGAIPAFLEQVRQADGARRVGRSRAIPLPGRLWARLVEAAGIPPDRRWAELSRAGMQQLAAQLCECTFSVDGKSTFKEEFVTAGGVSRKEVDFRTFESRKQPGLFLAGEVLDVDAITGGFNFQNAWTGAYLAAQAIAGSLPEVQESSR
ncbi:NAD(P)/FAD-dependent oxidoreductase [Robiginitalea sp. SC105]|uniref:NAD(P)/FAD-dependent oxidoreductase n=1 Tax=Robiginitalea sp. SC105 TaxID=2762332 RepID=UPI001639E9FE|nr:NAD(P)/FAD-dependent oxidoreductase [Robiginitalea sp. SC105]MBC2837848.1 NAD(P)/FAD-dependent oxidoreductase [Robiginitalea sp. SC105]